MSDTHSTPASEERTADTGSASARKASSDTASSHTASAGTASSHTASAGSASARTIEQHCAEIAAILAPLTERLRAEAPEFVSVRDPALLGRVTARALRAGIPLPPFDNSQMDGYAVRGADIAGASAEHPVALPLGITTAAGDPPLTHRPGTASPIMTGAAIPTGADAVVPVEATLPPEFPPLSRAGDPAPVGEAAFTAPVAPGAFVRPRGSDLAEGEELLAEGTRMSPARIGALAAAGVAEVPVRHRIRVLLCSTGDELGAGSRGAGEVGSEAENGGIGGVGGAALPPGRIHDANGPMLAAAMREFGAEVRIVRTADNPEGLLRALADAAPRIDLIVTSGGISAGAYEVVRDALQPLGVVFHRLAMQPGGPQGLGVLALRPAGHPADPDRGGQSTASIPVLCFPGNPVSAMLSAELFLLPTLREHAGLPSGTPREDRLLAHDTDSPAGKLQLRRGRIEADGRVALSGPSSHLLAGLAAAEVIAEIPVGIDRALENTPVSTWRINGLEHR